MGGSNSVLSREIVSNAKIFDPETPKEEDICPAMKTLKRQFIKSVENEMKEARKEG
jgi:hypothetical protein